MMTWLYPNCLDDVMDRRSYDSYDRLTALNNWLSELELWLWLCLCHVTLTMTMMMAMEAIQLDLANGSIHSVQSLTLLMSLLGYWENSFMWSSKGYVCKARLRKEWHLTCLGLPAWLVRDGKCDKGTLWRFCERIAELISRKDRLIRWRQKRD